MQTLNDYNASLTANANASQNTLTVSAIPTIAITDTVYAAVGSEGFTFNGSTGTPGAAGTLTGITRGIDGTTAASHVIGDIVTASKLSVASLTAGFSPIAPVVIVHADSSETPYKTPATALTAAVSGDTIYVYQSFTVNTNLSKNGVNWYFAPGVTITNNSNSAGFMFDDNGATVAQNIYGQGNFVRSLTTADGSVAGVVNGSIPPGNVGIFNQSNGSSVSTFNFNQCQMIFAVTTGVSNYFSVISSIAGKCKIKGGDIVLSDSTGNVPTMTAFWWVNGDMVCVVDRMYYTTVVATGSGMVYLGCTDSTTGFFYLTAQEIDSGADINGVIVSEMTTATGAAWVQCPYIRGGTYTDGGKIYITAQKFIGSVVQTATVSNSEVHLVTEKIGGATPETAYLKVIGANSKLWVTCNKFDPTSSIPFLYADTGAKVFFDGLDITPLSGVNAINVKSASTVVNAVGGAITVAGGGKSFNVATGSTVNVAAGFTFDGTTVQTAGSGKVTTVGGPVGTSNNSTGQTAAIASVISYTPFQLSTFRIDGYLTVTARVTDVIQMSVTYTDETATSRTLAMTGLVSATGVATVTPVLIRAATSAAIVVSTAFTTGGGSMTYDVGASIQQVN